MTENCLCWGSYIRLVYLISRWRWDHSFYKGWRFNFVYLRWFKNYDGKMTSFLHGISNCILGGEYHNIRSGRKIINSMFLSPSVISWEQYLCLYSGVKYKRLNHLFLFWAQIIIIVSLYFWPWNKMTPKSIGRSKCIRGEE